MPGLAMRALPPVCAVLFALGLSACAKTVSTTGLTGESKKVAETIKNLQSDVTAGDQAKICEKDLASALVKRLNSSHGGCKQAIKDQLAEIDSFELSLKSVSATPPTATAQVLSIFAGKSRPATVSLVKESGKWKISGLREVPHV